MRKQEIIQSIVPEVRSAFEEKNLAKSLLQTLHQNVLKLLKHKAKKINISKKILF